MTRSTASRRARNSDSLMMGGRRLPVSRPSRRRWRLASSRVEPLTARTSSASAVVRDSRMWTTVSAGSTDAGTSPPGAAAPLRCLRRVGGLTGTALAAAAAAAPAPARTSCCAVAIVPAIVGTWPGWLGRRPAGGLGRRPAGQLGRLEDQDGRLERGRGYRLGSAGRPVAAPGGPRRGRLVAGNAWNGGHAGARRTRSGPAGRCLGRARCGVRARLEIRLVGGLAYGPAAPAQQAAPMAAFLTCGLTLAGSL